MDVEARRIGAEDWPELRRLRLEALQDSPLAFVEQYEELRTQPDEFWRARADRGAQADHMGTFVVERDGALVAKASCFIEPGHADQVCVHVVGVYVTPRWRGRGVADAVVGAAMAWAREYLGADRIRLFVTDVNARAAAFYTRLGFVRTGATTPYPPDPRYTEYEMEFCA